MRRVLFSTRGGDVALPDRRTVLIDRLDGGNLVVLPPREVWDRSELTLAELTGWSCLVAATGRAMLESLPQLADGCINYWDAGNWALNDAADPPGVRKRGPLHRSLHLHLLGRSRSASSASCPWGEAPRFPDFRDRYRWASGHQRLTAEECGTLVTRAGDLLRERYAMPADAITPSSRCTGCGYPTPRAPGTADPVCEECRTTR